MVPTRGPRVYYAAHMCAFRVRAFVLMDVVFENFVSFWVNRYCGLIGVDFMRNLCVNIFFSYCMIDLLIIL